MMSAAVKPSIRRAAAACSASPMWAANAATVTPSADAADGRVHFTPANLVTNLHRSLEHQQTKRALDALFPDPARFAVHDALPSVAHLADEGAANHMRLCDSHDAPGVEVFDYGKPGGRFPARQHEQASRAVARLHGLDLARIAEAQDTPLLHRTLLMNAFTEGWGLYAESLGKEMGLFTDPYQWYGRLSDEQLRAMRLVVDTGLHYYGWDRQQAIDYMLANSSMAESDVIAEVERYIVIPGQALAYKVGQRVIRELREEAEAELGDQFDVRAFHRQVLVDGALPMGVLQTKIREWIAAEKAKQA